METTAVMATIRLYVVAWHAAIALTLVGIVGVGFGWQSGSRAAATLGGSALAIFTLATAWRKSRETVEQSWNGIPTVLTGGIALFVAVGVTVDVLPFSDEESVITLATSVQLFLLAIDRYPADTSRNTRWRVLIAGHSAVAIGSALELDLIIFRPGAALLLYATGFSLLLLHAFWMYQLDNSIVPPQPNAGPRHQEAILLIALMIGNIGAVAASLAVAVALSMPSTRITQTGSVVAGVAAVVAFAMLSAPPSPPSRLDPLTGIIATVLQHAGIFVIVLNLIVISAFFVAPGAFFWILGIYLLLLTVGVAVEYLEIAYAHRQLDDDFPSLPHDVPLTVVVTAAFEADVLPESLSHNLDTLKEVPFIVVPAAKSTDGTVEIARGFQSAHPDRVDVIEGTTGSKAGDLNQVWDHIETPYALVLDADETVDAELAAKGVHTLQENPQMGVIQGRKAAAYPDTGGLARFVSAERRYSTWVDHPFMDEIFSAGHFGGSTAIFRREVPMEVDGWRPEVLTEDIDLTLRLYLQTDWEVGYDPMMVARESNPATLRALVRQRIRWARGWIQVTNYHIKEILRARRKLGFRQTVGLSWLLFTAVSAPASVVFPAFTLLWFVGLAPALPLVLAIPLAVFLLPARAVSFGYASLRDPIIPSSVTPSTVIEGLAHAYLWVPFAWVIQLHALYLQFVNAPQVWHITQKTSTKASTSRSVGERTQTSERASEPES